MSSFFQHVRGSDLQVLWRWCFVLGIFFSLSGLELSSWIQGGKLRQAVASQLSLLASVPGVMDKLGVIRGNTWK